MPQPNRIRRSLVTAVLTVSLATLAMTPAVRAEPSVEANPPAASQPVKKDAVDFRKLKELLPDAIGGVKRSDAEGSKQAIGEMKISQAEASFSEEGKEGSANLTIVDYGAMPGTAQAMTSWSTLEIDEEGDTNYRKTYKINGYHALENYDKENKSGEIVLLVGDRFVVTLNINDLPGETLKQAAEAMKLKELEALGK